MAEREPTQREVAGFLREQTGPQVGYLVFMWVFSAVTMGLIMWVLPIGAWSWWMVLGWATAITALEGWRKHRTARQLGPVEQADPVLVEITRLEPRRVVVRTDEGEVLLPMRSTGGLSVGDHVWASPAPAVGRSVALVPHERRLGTLTLIHPRGAAEPA